MSRTHQPHRSKKHIEHPTPPRFSRRAFIKGTAGVATSALIANQFAPSSEAFREYLPYDQSRDAHYGFSYGWLQHHRPPTETTDEKFVFVRLKYPGGDWYTNAVDWYRWGFGAADVKFAEVLAQKTSIDVETHQHAQYVSIDDEHIFNYPYIFMTGHMGIRLSDSQVKRLREYLERGGFIHAEDCDIRLYNGRGGMRPSIHHLMERLVFPDKKLERIDISHPIYHTLFDHDEYLGGDKLLPERVSPYGHFDEAIMVDDRVVVYFCPTDLNCAWEGRECAPGGEEQRRWAFRQGMNVVAYALSR